MKLLLTFAILPLLLSNCTVVDQSWEPVGSSDGSWQRGNGVTATEIRSLPAFDRVRLDGPVHVIVKTGPSYSAYVTADANLTEYFRTDASGGTLTIGSSYGLQYAVEPEITIIVPELNSLTHYGDGLVEIEEDGNFPDVSLTLNGNGEIRYYGTAANLLATMNGSGSIYLEGYAALLDAELRGSGSIHGENLLTGDADVVSSGSGPVYLDLDYESTLRLSLTGSGKVEWWGAPYKLDYAISGSGKVVEHRGLPKKTAGAKVAANAAGAKTAATTTLKQGAAKRGAYPDKPYDTVVGKK